MPNDRNWVESGQALTYDGHMPKVRVAFLLALLALPQFGCDALKDAPYSLGYTGSLGDYVVESVSLVPKPPDFASDYRNVLFLRVDLTSKYRLSIGPRTHWIGVASDFCPLQDDHKLIALGPYVESAHEAGIIGEDTLAIKSTDGLFRYHVYLHPEFPIPGVKYGAPTSGPNAQAEYDLLNDGRNLCLQIFGGDHYNVFARSSVIEIDARSLKNAAASRFNLERKLPD